LTIKAGVGQATTNLQEWQNSAGTVLSYLDPNGFFQFPASQKHGNATQVQLFGGGTVITSDCAMFDANGNVVSAGGSCGSVHVPVFQDADTPAGAINGSNAVFTLANSPNPAASLTLARNGVVQKAAADYNLSGNSITFTSGAIPQTGDTLQAWYRIGTSAPSSAAGGDLAGNYPNPTLKNTGTAGTYTKVTTDAQGRVSSGAQAAASDLSNGTTGSGAIVLTTGPSIANPSLGSGYISESKTSGSTGTTANLLVRLDSSGSVVTSSTSDTGALGVALSTLASGNSVQVATRGVVQCIADNATTINNLTGIGTTTAGRCRDLGVSSTNSVSVATGVIGRFLSGVTAGSLASVELFGPGHHGFQVQISDLPAGIPNANLANSSITINGSSTALGGSVSVGTVTSAGLSMPSDFSVSGSPVTGAGTISVTVNNQNANTFKAGPGSGAAAAPTYRALVPADLPVLNTANQGYFFGISVTPPTSDGATTALSANQMKVYQFVLPFAIAVNNLTFEVTTGSGTCSGTCHANIGLYDAGCASLVAQTGVMTSGGSPNINATGTYSISVQNGSGTTGNVTLAPGVYWLAYTSDSTSLLLRAVAFTSHAMNYLTNQANKLAALAGNASSGGAFPASCGALTTATTNVPPMVLFQR
jgi:hypothetical protein